MALFGFRLFRHNNCGPDTQQHPGNNQKQASSYKVVLHGSVPEWNNKIVADASEKIADYIVTPKARLRICELADYLSDFLAIYLAILGELNGNFGPVRKL